MAYQYKGVRKGSVIRNSSLRLKSAKVEPRLIWNDTVMSARLVHDLMDRCTAEHPDCEPAALHYIRYDTSGQLLGSCPKIYLIDVEHDCIVEAVFEHLMPL